MNRVATVIEFTSRSLKLVEGSVDRKGILHISRHESADIFRYDDERVSLALNRMVPVRGARGACRPIVIFPCSYAALRYLILPSQDRDEIYKMVGLQISQHTPHSREDVLFDFIITENLSTGHSKILLMIVPQAVGGRYANILQKSGLSPLQFTVSSMGLLKWHSKFFKNDDLAHSAVVFVHMDHLNVEVCFFAGDRFLFSRSVDMDGSIKDIESLLVAYIQDAVTIYENEGFTKAVGEFILSPGCHETESLRNQLENRYRVPVRFYDPFKESFVKFEKPERRDSDDRDKVSYLSAIGMILNGARAPVDFLLPEAKAKNRKDVRRRQWAQTGVLMALAFGFLMLFLGIQMRQKNADLLRLRNETDGARQVLERMQRKSKQIQFIKREVLPSFFVVDILSQVSAFTPDDIFWEAFSIEDADHLFLKGTSANDRSVNQFYHNMVGTRFLSDVKLEYSRKRKIRTLEVTEFLIRAKISEGEKTQ